MAFWRLIWIVFNGIIICLNSCTIKLYLKSHTASWVPFLNSICIILFFLVQRNVNRYSGTFLKCIASEWLPHFISVFLFHDCEHPWYDYRWERQALFLKMHNSLHWQSIRWENYTSWPCFWWFKSGKTTSILWN